MSHGELYKGSNFGVKCHNLGAGYGPIYDSVPIAEGISLEGLLLT